MRRIFYRNKRVLHAIIYYLFYFIIAHEEKIFLNSNRSLEKVVGSGRNVENAEKVAFTAIIFYEIKKICRT